MKKFNGLTNSLVEQRIKEGKVNKKIDIRTDNIITILLRNFVTLFNILNLFLALLLIFAKEYKNLLFLGVVITNTIISTFHEFSAKKVTDKLSILESVDVTCIRDGVEILINSEKIVLGDTIKILNNETVVADSIILDGEVLVNESLITGEDDLVKKKENDMLLSGSIIVSGQAITEVIHVGDKNYANKIVIDSKYIKNNRSEIMNSINTIVKFMSYIIVPLGIILYLKQYNITSSISKSITNTVAAIIGMIPEGLVLLTSTVFVLGIVKLFKKKTVVKNLYSVENLARVDTICFDKTGTLTKGNLKLNNIIYFDKDKRKVDKMINLLISNSVNFNESTEAIKKIYNKNYNYNVIKTYDFSSDKKYSGVSIKNYGTILLGAAEVLTKDNNILSEIENYSTKYRCLLLSYTSELWDENMDKLENLAIILIEDELRENIDEVINYLYNEDIDIKIITGDNLITTKKVAKKCGIKKYWNIVDLRNIKTYEELEKVVNENTVFVRTSPFQKKEIIKILKQNNKVAMIGDGINDVMALKEADFSITIDGGSNPAKTVSDAILIDSDFTKIPEIIQIGRKQIFNLERSASLFLVKTLYSFFLSIIFIFLDNRYPFIPIQLTLISVLTIGIPSFVLALENTNFKANGEFLINVLKRSLAASLTIIFNIVIVIILSYILKYDYKVISTMCVILTGLTGFTYLYTLCLPFNKIKTILYISLTSLFTICVLFLRELFSLSFISYNMLALVTLIFIISVFMFNVFTNFSNKFINKHEKQIVK